MKFKLLFSYFSVGILALIISVAILPPKISGAASTGITISLVPENPAPNQNTTVNLNSYVENLDSAKIAWSINGQILASGVGKKSFSTNAPSTGGETSVVATIYLPSGPIQTSITIRPSMMVMLWQADDSYVPPFYKGKALAAADTEIKIIAMPEIRNGSSLLDPINMTYAWKKDYTNNVDGSGYGKNYFVYTSDYLEDSNNVSVTATTLDQTRSANAYIDVGMTEPKILFYKNDPTFGTLLANAFSDTHKITDKELLEAVPYFISPKELRNPILTWNWSINDEPVTLTDFRKNLMPLQVKEGTHGTSKLNLEITNQYKIFQTASKELNIEF
ncbi:MAG: hypothetical protein WCI76_00890 [bacterium]